MDAERASFSLARFTLPAACGLLLLILAVVVGATIIASRVNLRYEGEIAYVGFSRRGADIFVRDLRRGRSVDLTAADGFDFNPAWSPDGQWIAFDSIREDNFDVYVMDRNGHHVRRVTTDGKSGSPAWSPDGQQLAFYSFREPVMQLYAINVNGSNQRKLTDQPYAAYNPAWSPDGKTILFQANGGTFSNYRLFAIDADGSHLRPITTADAISFDAAWSPDGQQIALFSNLNFSRDVYVVSTEPNATPQRVSFGSGYSGSPAWSADGRWLAYDSDGGPGVNFYGSGWSIYIANLDCLDQPEGCAHAAVRIGDGLRPSWKP
jgi:Tol biopolymer transport system component